jgi:hypothetical protein
MDSAVKRVNVLFIEGCPSRHQTIARIRSAASALGVPIELLETEVTMDAIADGFCGSPTVLVNGMDLEKDARPVESLCCRTYQTESGIQGAPSLDLITRGLR